MSRCRHTVCRSSTFGSAKDPGGSGHRRRALLRAGTGQGHQWRGCGASGWATYLAGAAASWWRLPSHPPRWVERLEFYWVFPPIVWIMQARMLAVLKRNIERAPTRWPGGCRPNLRLLSTWTDDCVVAACLRRQHRAGLELNVGCLRQVRDRRLRPPTREPRRVHATQTSATTVRADEVAHHESEAVGLTRAMPSTAPASLRRPVGDAALYARPPSSGIREWEVRSSWRSRTRGSGVLPVVRGHRRRQRVLCGSVAHRGIAAVVPLSRVSFRPSAEPSDWSPSA